ncbi:MAG: translocation/assembly module TamB domain-containing protein [Bacteroidota bacterium]
MYIWPGARLWETAGLAVLVIAVLTPKHFFRSILILLCFLLMCFLLVQTSLVQTWLAGQASSRLSKGLGTRVSVKKVNFSFFSKMQMEGVYVEDKNKDTLLYAGQLKVNINDWFFLRDTAVLQYVGLEDATIYLHRSDSTWNYQFLVDYFSGSSDTSKKKSIQLQLQKAELKNIHLLKRDGWRGEDMGFYLASLNLDAREIDFNKKLVDINTLAITEPIFSIYNYEGKRTYKPPSTIRDPNDTNLVWNISGWKILATKVSILNGAFKDEKKSDRAASYYFDAQHIQFTNINAVFKNLTWVKDTISAAATLTAKERSGFEIKAFKANMKWQPRAMEFNSLDIQTNKSHLTNYFVMRYNNFDDMGDFIEKVQMQGNFKSALVHSDDIAYFAPELANWKKEIFVTGALHGTVADLKGKGIIIKAGNNTTLNGDIALKGLPDIDKTFIDFKSNDFRTTYADVLTVIPALKTVNEPRLDRLQFIHFRGNFTGFIKDFVTRGTIETGLGIVVADVAMKFPANDIPGYSGKISSAGFNLGSLVDNNNLGNIAFNVGIKGNSFKINNIQAKLDGTVSNIDFNDYNYKNIKVNGTLAKRLFNGELHADDADLGLSLNGLVDFSKTDPRFNFFATVNKANLKRLKLYKDDIDFNGSLRFDFTGDNIDDFLGTAKIYDAAIFKNGQRISFDSLTVESKKTGNSKSIVVESNEFDAALAGEYSIRELPTAFQIFLNRYYPSYIKPSTHKITNENFSFVITTKKIDDYLDLVDKNLKGFNNSNFSGRINSKENLFNLDADVPQFSYKNTSFSNTNIQGRGNLDSLNLGLTVGDVFINDSLHFPGTKVTIRSASDISKINITTSANQTLNSADISGRFQTKSNGFSVIFDPSTFDINGKRWTIDKNGELTLTRDIITTEGLKIYSGDQEVLVTSHLSEAGQGTDLDVDLKKINIGDFAPFFIKSNRLEGLLTGKVNINDPFGNMNVDVNATAEQFRLDDDSVGKIQISTGYSKASGRVALVAISENKNYNFDLNGFINTADSTGTGIDLTTHLKDKTSIHLLQRYLTGIFSHLDGYAAGDLRVVGKGKNLKYLGDLTLTDASLMVDYTRCTYHITKATVKLQDDGIDFGSFEIKDELNNTAEVLNGKLYHNNFKDMAFDFRVKTNRLLLLNTTNIDNKQFYGRAIGKATVSFKGPQEDMQMDIQGEPTDSSVISLPIASSRLNGEADFLTWKVYGKEMQQTNAARVENNLTVNLKMTANKFAKINVILDEAAGDQISAVGHGVLNMNVGTNSNLSLNGRFDIDKGDYTFTFQSIKRRFKLSEGEPNYIMWHDDPYNADINVVAEYTAPNVRFSDLGTNNNPALAQFNTNVKNYVGDVLVKTTITNKLKNLDFKFDIELPSYSSLADNPDALELLKLIQRDENERNKQSSLLIVFNSFGPLSSSTNALNPGAIAFQGIFLNSLSGVVSNQLSRAFSNVLQNVFRDPNFRINVSASAYNGTVLTDVASTTTQYLPDRGNVGFSVNKSYFNERLTFIVGSALDFGFNNTSVSNSRNNIQFLPDVTAQYKLTSDGKILLNLFYRENRSYLTSLTGKQSRSGASISYRKEFETFGDLFRKKKIREVVKPAVADSTRVTSVNP